MVSYPSHYKPSTAFIIYCCRQPPASAIRPHPLSPSVTATTIPTSASAVRCHLPSRHYRHCPPSPSAVAIVIPASPPADPPSDHSASVTPFTFSVRTTRSCHPLSSRRLGFRGPTRGITNLWTKWTVHKTTRRRLPEELGGGGLLFVWAYTRGLITVDQISMKF